MNTVDTENYELQQALQIIQITRRSLFLTGKAGTGKSTFMRYIASTIKKKCIILAPTGIAAINAGGSTLHSFFKLPFHPLLPSDSRYSATNIKNTLKYNSEKRKLLREVELIIIDEISMVRADIIDFIHKVLCVYNSNMRAPFGGKQLLLVGDIYQLEPVIKEEDRQLLRPYYKSAFFFDAHIFQDIQLISIELQKVYRQTDRTFISILDNIRSSHVTDQDLSLLNTRVGAPIEHSSSTLSITLSTRRDTVDHINEQQLSLLPEKKTIFRGQIEGDFPQSALPTPMKLELKNGAQIIFIKNDKDKRWVNGTLGTIIGFSDIERRIYVRTEEGNDYDVEIETWENIKYTFNEIEQKIEESVIGTYKQFPLRLAWAITVHKSQGLTFHNVKIDFTGGVFAAGQTYVALSRCTSLQGISLGEPIRKNDIFVRQDVINFAKYYNDNIKINKALQESKADKEYSEAIKAFDKGNFQQAIDHFFIAIHNRYDIEKPTIKRFIRRKLHSLNSNTTELKKLKKQLTEKNELLKRLSVEYTLLGKEAEKEGMRNAAISNYEKALETWGDNPEANRRLERLKRKTK